MSAQTHPRPNYAGVFLTLFVFTVVEIAVANAHWARTLTILLLVFLAVVKATLVALFYMHLRFEKVLLAAIILIPFAFSFMLTISVGLDIGHVRP